MVASRAIITVPAVLVWVLDLLEQIAKVLTDQGYRGTLATLTGNFFTRNHCVIYLSTYLSNLTRLSLQISLCQFLTLIT